MPGDEKEEESDFFIARNALRFATTGSYLKCQEGTMVQAKTMTMECWIKKNSGIG